MVLIDEIDKAPRDFPNDLLGSSTKVTSLCVSWAKGTRIKRREGAPPPLVVITSNSERRLPEAFLRRCIFHHIDFTIELVNKAVAARRPLYARLSDQVIHAAVSRFLELRQRTCASGPRQQSFWLGCWCCPRRALRMRKSCRTRRFMICRICRC